MLRDIDNVVAVVITLKTHYPKVDIGGIIKRKPKLLLSTQQRVDEDAVKVGTNSVLIQCSNNAASPFPCVCKPRFVQTRVTA